MLRIIMHGVVLSAALALSVAPLRADPTPKQTLGKNLFFDSTLSVPTGQSCSDCHHPSAGFADPDTTLPVSSGAVAGRTGTRNSPTAAYAAYSPPFYLDTESGLYIGGQFWDGRAATLADQANRPFLNPVEMNNANAAQVVDGVRNGPYADQFRAVYGPTSLDNADSAYDMVADAIAAYESSPEISPFTSKYDYYLKGQAALTTREASGLALFSSPMKGNCSACHSLETKPGTPGPLLTDFSYDNLGIPKNMAIPAYQDDPTLQDLGLGAIVGDPNENGKFKVPTLRNVAVTGPWGHNGFFTSLEDIIQFYNARDVTPEVWGMPEVPETVNTTELGDLGLTPDEVADIGYFLNTLTDGYVPEPCTVVLLATSGLVLAWRHRWPRKANAARARPTSYGPG